MSDDQLPIEDRPYDGIVEDNNPLPGWWKTILYVCTLFAIAYMVVVHSEFLVSARTDLQRFDAEMAAMRYSQDSLRSLKPPFVYEEMTALLIDPDRLAQGKSIYIERCLACHATGGAGAIGPNLTDDFWIHSARVDSVAYLVLNGVASKGMPTWGNLLSDDQIKSVAVYVKSLRGTNPPNPKAPQGVLDTL
jgi:cytochrome c oxidase cbb3-type subunit III